MPLSLDHWNKMKRFVGLKAEEQKITDFHQQLELFQQHWDSLLDEEGLDKKFEDIEVAQLTLGIPQREEELRVAKARKAELDAKRAGTR